MHIEDASFQSSAKFSSCLGIAKSAAQKVQVSCRDCKCLLLKIHRLSMTLEVFDVDVTERAWLTNSEETLKNILNQSASTFSSFFRRIFNTTAVEIQELSLELQGSVNIHVAIRSASVYLDPSGKISIATFREVKVDSMESACNFGVGNVFLSMQSRTHILSMDGVRVDFKRNAMDLPSIFFLQTPLTLVCSIPSIDVTISNPLEFLKALNKLPAALLLKRKVPISSKKNMALSVSTVSICVGSAVIDLDKVHILANESRMGAYIHGATYGSNSVEGLLLFNAGSGPPFQPIFCVRDLYISRGESTRNITQAEKAMKQLFQLFSLPWLESMAEYKVLNLHFID